MLKKISIFSSIFFLCVLFFLGTCFAITLKEHVNTLVQKSTEYSKQGKTLLAITMIDEAIRLQPRNIDLVYKRAFIYGRAGQCGQAINDFSRVMASSNRYGHAIRFRADCFVAVGMAQNAVQDYSSFLKSAPKDGKVWSYLVEALMLMGDREGALDAVRRGLATGSHWSGRLTNLQNQILNGEKITRHKPLSN